ncbi:transmembrane protein 116-like [Pholidichthys leucotaenia]
MMELDSLLSEKQIDILSTLYLVFLTPSVIGSFSVLVVSIARWRHLKEQVHILVQLAFADLLASLILMSASVMNKVGSDDSVVICKHILPLSLAFYFISFLLMVVYAWKSKNAIQGWRDRPANDEGRQCCRRKNTTILIYITVWVIPLALYVVYVLTPLIKTTVLIPATDSSNNDMIPSDSTFCNSCILFLHIWKDSCSDTEPIHDTFIRVFLFIIVISVMVSCSVIYYKVGKWYERREQERLFPVEGHGCSRNRVKTVFSTARRMVLVIFFCWAPALLLIVLSSVLMGTDVKQRSLFGLYMFQAVSVSLQGFLNSMVYAWRRPNFTEAVLRESTPLLWQDHQAFFEESLKSQL